MSAEAATIRIRFPDGAEQEAPHGARAGDLLARWDPKRAKEFLAATFDGVAIDLSRPVEHSGLLAPLTFADPAGREILEHSSAHLVAKAVTEVIPGALPTNGPPTEDGFYYDFDVRPLTPDDLTKVDDAMRDSVAKRESYERREVSKSQALDLFARNPHKLAYLETVGAEEPVSVYVTGAFTDLCRGPHVPDTGWLKGVHILGFSGLTSGEGAKTEALQRVRGVGFPTRELLNEYLARREEAEARDHRVLGQRLGLFLFSDDAAGFPFWLPNGMIVVRELERFVTEHFARDGYSEVRTPLLFAQGVYETSGHWQHYRENMFLSEIEGRTFGWKPMNCPGSMLIFRSKARSYRELPMRLAEFAPLHRFEPSGTLHGLARVREFVQDDAHLFVTAEQIEPELRALLDWVRRAFTTFQFSWTYELSTRPAQALGDSEDWTRAEEILQKVLKESGVEYRSSPGEGAFYAPKIDIHIRDSLGRPWQTGTIQLDFQMPRRFGLQYQGPDGKLHAPAVIHRTILGSWERFLGVLLEHTAGRLPPWLSPVQVRVLPIAERHEPAASRLVDRLRGASARADWVPSQESLSKRVRSAELERVPYVLVVGDKEGSTGSVTVRVAGTKENRTMSEVDFLSLLADRVSSRSFTA